MDAFLRTILIVLLVYFVLRFSLKLLWPYIVRYITKKAGQKMESAFKNFESFQQPQQPNESTAQEPVTKKSSKVVGEYIDFEEID